MKKLLITFLFPCLTLLGANPSFDSFDTNYFRLVYGTYGPTSIQLQTNLFANGTNTYIFYSITNVYMVSSNLDAGNIQGTDGRLSRFIGSGSSLSNSIAYETNGALVVEGSDLGNGAGVYTPGWYATTNVLNSALNVMAFGADPTGVTNSAPAIQAAIDSLRTSTTPAITGTLKPSGTVFIPPGLYKISSPLKLYSGVAVHGAGRDVTTISNSTTTASSFTVEVQAGANTQCFSVRDMTIVGSESATDGCGIDCRVTPITINPPWPMVENVFIIGHKYSIRLDGTVMGTFKNIRANSASSHGIYSTGDMAAVSFEDVWAILSGGDGWRIEKAVYCSWTSVAAQSCLGNGYTFGTTTGNHLTQCRIQGGAEGNTTNGWYFIEPFGGHFQIYTYLNGGVGCKIEGAKGLFLMPTLQADQGACSLSLLPGPTYGEPEGIVIVGDVISGNPGGINVDNPSRADMWAHRSYKGRRSVDFGDKTVIVPSSGDIEAGNSVLVNYRIGIGTTNPLVRLHSVNDGVNQTLMDSFSALNYQRSDYEFRRAAGTFSNPSNVVDGSSLGTLGFYGLNDGTYRKALEIEAIMPGALLDATHVPAKLTVNTSSGLADPATALTVDDTGVDAAVRFKIAGENGITQTETWAATGTNWTMIIKGGIITSLTHTP